MQVIPELSGDDRGEELQSKQEWLSQEMILDSPNPNSISKIRDNDDNVQNIEDKCFIIEESEPTCDLIEETQFESTQKIKKLQKKLRC